MNVQYIFQLPVIDLLCLNHSSVYGFFNFINVLKGGGGYSLVCLPVPSLTIDCAVWCTWYIFKFLKIKIGIKKWYMGHLEIIPIKVIFMKIMRMHV